MRLHCHIIAVSEVQSDGCLDEVEWMCLYAHKTRAPMKTSMTIVAIVGSVPCEYVVTPWSYALQTWPAVVVAMAIEPTAAMRNRVIFW